MGSNDRKEIQRLNEKTGALTAISRRDFGKLAFGLLGTVGMGRTSLMKAGEGAQAADPALIQIVPYGIGPCWPMEYGDVRVQIKVAHKADAVRVHIPWRRRDSSPESKNIFLLDAKTGQPVKNLARININREFGDIVFQPPRVPGAYNLYYMPNKAHAIPWEYSVQYDAPHSEADPAWLELHELQADRLSGEKWKSLPSAKVIEIQARTDFGRFDPMEVIATQEETQKLLAAHPSADYLLFPEDRRFPIRMTDDLPLRWILNGPSNEFRGEARIDEFYVFQTGVFACRKAVENLSIDFTELKSSQGHVIPASTLRCFNLGGTDWLGRPFKKEFAVPQGKIGALWFGIQIPKEAAAGDYHGNLVVRIQGHEPCPLKLALKVVPQRLDDAGDSEIWRHSRLRWLDSTVGVDDDITAPFTPMTLSGRTVGCLNRQVRFAATGLPDSIRSNGREILAGPLNFLLETAEGKTAWTGGKPKVLKSTRGSVEWESSSTDRGFALRCHARMEFDGHIDFSLTVKTRQAVQAKDLRLEIPIRKDVALYMMGMSRRGGYRPQEWKWTWNLNRANNNVWMGDYNAGFQIKLKGPRDTWDIADLKAAGIPPTWGNEGKGGCTVTEEGGRVLLRAYSGERSLEAGEEMQFRFALLVTPFKPLDPGHWNQRYYHFCAPPEEAARAGANIINIHQGNELNPNINYPFTQIDRLTSYINQAHAQGLKVKIYYTVRELTNYTGEFWALRSLGHEIFEPGPGGGSAWLREHVVSDYQPAWHETLPDGEVDSAIATTGLSRWHNYYLEGLAWLLRNAEIDGLYLDGIGYDRQIMKRVRKVLDRNHSGSLIDFHSGDEFPYKDLQLSPANKYMEHFPFLNSLWFGEMYDYNKSPDYWLVEVSGIPFGLFGEMLQDDGNPWRGMVYGMTGRLYQSGHANPKPLWTVWDEFGIQKAEMIGYWDPHCPVRTNHEGVLATVYRRKKRALISIASWEKETVNCRLKIDWQALGMNPETSTLVAQEIPSFQKEARFAPSDQIPVEPGRGWLLILEEKS